MNKGVILAFIPAVSLAYMTISPTLNDGVYTLEQVEKGAEVFDEYCRECHTVEQNLVIFQTWNEQNLNVMYDTMSATMPQDNAGSLPLDDYTHALAYILSIMGYPAGDQALNPYDGSMKEIAIEPANAD